MLGALPVVALAAAVFFSSLAICGSDDVPLLVVDVVTSSFVRLAWSFSGSAILFVVRQDGTAIAQLAANTATYTASGLQAETQYTFTVEALLAGGQAAAISPATVVTTLANPSALPTPPTVAAVPISDRQIKITWSGVPSGNQYVLRQIQGSLRRVVYTGPLLTFLDRDLEPATLYQYQVKVGNEVGFSAYSDPAVQATTLSTFESPTPVTSLELVNVTSLSFTVQWSVSDADRRLGVLSYTVLRNDVLARTIPVDALVAPGTVLSVTLVAEPLTDYTVRVGSHNTAGHATSEAVTFQTPDQENCLDCDVPTCDAGEVATILPSTCCPAWTCRCDTTTSPCPAPAPCNTSGDVLVRRTGSGCCPTFACESLNGTTCGLTCSGSGVCFLDKQQSTGMPTCLCPRHLSGTNCSLPNPNASLCGPHCKDCDEALEQCTQCTDNQFLLHGFCYPSCPSTGFEPVGEQFGSDGRRCNSAPSCSVKGANGAVREERHLASWCEADARRCFCDFGVVDCPVGIMCDTTTTTATTTTATATRMTTSGVSTTNPTTVLISTATHVTTTQTAVAPTSTQAITPDTATSNSSTTPAPTTLPAVTTTTTSTPSAAVVDGGWSEWGPWSSCACTPSGPGDVQRRSRSCTAPVPGPTGKACTGSSRGARACRCPIDGGYGEWGLWSPCACQDRVQTRHRDCDNPLPEYSGLTCLAQPGLGQDKETQPCTNASLAQANCPGGYGAWNASGTCSATCGRGQRLEQRQCNSPAPTGQGVCDGAATRLTPCQVVPCDNVPATTTDEPTIAATTTPGATAEATTEAPSSSNLPTGVVAVVAVAVAIASIMCGLWAFRSVSKKTRHASYALNAPTHPAALNLGAMSPLSTTTLAESTTDSGDERWPPFAAPHGGGFVFDDDHHQAVDSET